MTAISLQDYYLRF